MGQCRDCKYYSTGCGSGTGNRKIRSYLAHTIPPNHAGRHQVNGGLCTDPVYIYLKIGRAAVFRISQESLRDHHIGFKPCLDNSFLQ
jgi:hypothetical protein